MKINYILLVPQGQEPNPESLKSFTVNQKEDDSVTIASIVTTEEAAINEAVEKTDDSFTHVCIISNENNIIPLYREIVADYLTDDTVLIPMVELCLKDGDKFTFRGFLNTCVWKPYLADNIGNFDLKLTKQQIDLTLYGSLIPLKIAKANKFKSNIKYYSHFEYLNRLAHKEVAIKGIPKVIVRCPMDYELKGVPKEEKVKFFKAAQIEYESDEDKVIA